VISKELLAAYSSAIVTDLQGNELAGTTSLPFPLFIITAQNPYSIKTSAINDTLHEYLQDYLATHFPAVQWEEAIGRSQDGQWKETSLAISGLSREQAVNIGRAFAQWAIFKLDSQGLKVVSCL
jgi:hypothetical protein